MNIVTSSSLFALTNRETRERERERKSSDGGKVNELEKSLAFPLAANAKAIPFRLAVRGSEANRNRAKVVYLQIENGKQ